MWPGSTTCQLSGHPAQDWLASQVQYDGGRLDGPGVIPPPGSVTG